jgi:hypothetical protein
VCGVVRGGAMVGSGLYYALRCEVSLVVLRASDVHLLVIGK